MPRRPRRLSNDEQDRYAAAARVPHSISDQLDWCANCANCGIDPITGAECRCMHPCGICGSHVGGFVGFGPQLEIVCEACHSRHAQPKGNQ